MLPEISLLKYILCYNIYIKYYKYINISKYNYKELSTIYGLIPKFFEKHGEKDASLEQYALFFFGYYPRLKPEEAGAYKAIFEQAVSANIEEGAAEAYVDEIRKRAIALATAERLLAYSEGAIDAEEVREGIETVTSQNVPRDEVSPYVSDDLEGLLNATIQKPGLRWRLGCLNLSLGSLRPGDFGFIFARPETGKTTFLASEVTFFASQTDRPILWFNNEEDGKKVKIRLFQAACGVPLETLYGNVKRYQAMYKDLVGNRILLVDDKSVHRSTIEQIVKEQAPAAIVIDQLDKVQGFEAERNDLMMGNKYQWARGLAVAAPLIGVCQADGTGEGVKWLNMNHVADAKTAKQAEADFMLGIGCVHHDDEPDEVRYFNVSKNKLFGDKDSDPKLRHGKMVAWMDASIARYKDMGT